MHHIVLEDAQAELIRRASSIIEIRDCHGRCLGYVAHGFTDEDITVAMQRMASNQLRYSTRDVLHHLELLSGDDRIS